MFELLAVVLGSYLLGSIPFALLVVRITSSADIRRAGSGNAGGYNAYVVTQSRLVGLIVGFLDALKGFVAVLLAGLLIPDSFWIQGVSLLGAVGGHNYPVWTGFKGGRGLSTTAGGLVTIGLVYTVAWCTLWVIARLLKRDILWSNLAAILLTPLVVWAVPWEWSERIIFVHVDRWTFEFFSCIISFVLLVGHLDAMKDVWKGSSGPDQNIPSSS